MAKTYDIEFIRGNISFQLTKLSLADHQGPFLLWFNFNPSMYE